MGACVCTHTLEMLSVRVHAHCRRTPWETLNMSACVCTHTLGDTQRVCMCVNVFLGRKTQCVCVCVCVCAYHGRCSAQFVCAGTQRVRTHILGFAERCACVHAYLGICRALCVCARIPWDLQSVVRVCTHTLGDAECADHLFARLAEDGDDARLVIRTLVLVPNRHAGRGWWALGRGGRE